MRSYPGYLITVSILLYAFETWTLTADILKKLQQGLPRQFYREQCKESEEEADKRSVGRITSVDRVEVLRRPKRI